MGRSGNEMIRPEIHRRRAPVQTKGEGLRAEVAVHVEPVSKSRQSAVCCQRTISKNGEDFCDDHVVVEGAGS